MSVTEKRKLEHTNEDEIEIRLSDIVQFLRDSRITILITLLVFFVIGIIYAFSLRNEYTASVKVMPELKATGGVGGGLGDLKSLAGLAGVNLGNITSTSEAIRPDLYPDIVQSIPFSLHILKQSVTTSSDKKSQTLEIYLKNNTKSNLTNLTNVVFGNREEQISSSEDQIFPALKLTKRQEELSKIINARVSAEMDKKSGIFTITSQMPDATVAAIVAQKTLDYLTSYVTDYRTSKARQQVQFLTQQVNESRRRYESMELRLSSYRDRNQSLYLNTAKIEEQRLQADYLLAQGVFSDLSKQLEQARIKVQEEAPVFQVLEPPRVPLLKSGPKRTLNILGFSLLGLFVGLVISIVKIFFHK